MLEFQNCVRRATYFCIFVLGHGWIDTACDCQAANCHFRSWQLEVPGEQCQVSWQGCLCGHEGGGTVECQIALEILVFCWSVLLFIYFIYLSFFLLVVFWSTSNFAQKKLSLFCWWTCNDTVLYHRDVNFVRQWLLLCLCTYDELSLCI